MKSLHGSPLKTARGGGETVPDTVFSSRDGATAARIDLEPGSNTEQEKYVTFFRPCEIEACSDVNDVAEYSDQKSRLNTEICTLVLTSIEGGSDRKQTIGYLSAFRIFMHVLCAESGGTTFWLDILYSQLPPIHL